MDHPLVTVVLPIYKVEKYLDRCVTSVVNQTYRNLQILMVDDGSPDQCPRMCDEWAQRDGRIQVIHKQNQGLGEARNTGIEYAAGEYICFFDSDDYIREDTVELCVRRARQEQAEFVVFGFASVSADGKITSVFTPGSDRTYRGAEVTGQFLPEYVAPDPQKRGERIFYMSSCMVLYAMDLIRRSGWRFVSERSIISEDVYSLMGLMKDVQSVAVVREALYFYCTNAESLSRSFRPDRYEKIRLFYLETIELCRRVGYNNEVAHRMADPYLAFTIGAMKQIAKADGSEQEKRQQIRNIVDDETLQQVLLQVRHDAMPWMRRMLFLLVRHRQYLLTYILLKAKA